ncbi:MAG TPA: cyclic pyranopterin monophosphate synthase MoaC [Bacteroidales bacterium]|nr:cyclic pyranopterin monophosphate synthase MoaC [Bacteroidales bacterium]HPT02991.1 cyclic pyranopterin monophosphate synthase MoaC [Bacteroidales bacterium]
MSKLSHTDSEGRAVMVDVSLKPVQLRKAVASGLISLQPGTITLIRENMIKKGDVLTVAQIAGIQAAKQTPSLIPLCHPLQISKVDVELSLDEKGVNCISRVTCSGQTGVEMEALTAVSTALLTVYDMCKAVDKQMTIGEIKLVEKTKTDI